MISDSEIKKRISETEFDIFPLDKMLPLATVYQLFKEEYEKVKDKSIFRRERRFQKLREGYFALFVAVALNKRNAKEYFICFPKSPDNDVCFLSVKNIDGIKPIFWKLICDIKEYTDYSKSFGEFIEQTITPKIKAYHMIIGIHANIDGAGLKPLAELSSKESTIWIVSALSPKDGNYNISVVTTFQGSNIVFQDEIDLSRDISNNDKPMMIYQDILRDKLV